MQISCVKGAKNFSLASLGLSCLLVNSSGFKKNQSSLLRRAIKKTLPPTAEHLASFVGLLLVHSMLLSPLHSMLLSLCFFFFSKTSALKASFGY